MVGPSVVLTPGRLLEPGAQVRHPVASSSTAVASAAAVAVATATVTVRASVRVSVAATVRSVSKLVVEPRGVV
jgi:hypothetical protein